MLTLELVQKIKAFRATGMTYSKIAEHVPVSMRTICCICNGSYHRQRSLEDFSPNCTYGRCPICGNKVALPCLACQIRPNKPAPMLDAALTPEQVQQELKITLEGDAQRRYEDIKRHRKYASSD
jgi:hypothetical protein